MNKLQIFKNSEFGEIRAVEIEGKIYFVANDIAKSLGYSDCPKAVRTHCKGVAKTSIPSNGGNQQMKVIPEGDIYRLIVKSRLPAAEKFESWVFDEVLPDIRKHGLYATDNVIEIYKDIKGFEGKYQVSNLGNVKSLRRTDNMGRIVKEKILSPYCDKKGIKYKSVILNDGKNTKCKMIHRLVAETFLPNQRKLNCVNHKDENKNNNNINNLEWCTIKYNNIYGSRLEKIRKPVLNVDTGEAFNSITELCNKYKYDKSFIVRCLKGKTKLAYGQKFIYI